MNEDIEKLLRSAPQFTPPATLKERLIEQVPMRGKERFSRSSAGDPDLGGGWLKRWWPAWVPGAISAACAMALTTQQGTIRELKANIQSLSQAPATESNARPDDAPSAAINTPAQTEQEIDRLKEVAARLKSEIDSLQSLKSENLKLRAQIAAPIEQGLTAEETEAMAKAKEKAQSIACINNLKQFGLAVRIWALDNNDSNPPNVVCMSNELSTPKILVCPADTIRQSAIDFFSFSMANCSYEFLAPSEVTDKEPQRLLSRCPIHGHIGLCDGSVQSKVAKEHPEFLVEQNGKLYLATPNATVQHPLEPNAAVPNSQEEPMNKFQQRYGIPPANEPAPNQQP